MAGNKPGPAKGDPRMIEHGKKGGSTVLAERGRDFFREIGRKGGKTTRERHGVAHYEEIGKKGGASLSRIKAERAASEDDSEGTGMTNEEQTARRSS